MKRFHRGEVVLVDYPFSDSKHQSKLRPAVVIREATPGKYLLCKITHIDRRARNKGQWVIKTSKEGIQN